MKLQKTKLIERIIDIYDQNGFITTEVELLQDRLNQGIIELKIFEKNTKLTCVLSGLPYIRTTIGNRIKQEMNWFLIGSILTLPGAKCFSARLHFRFAKNVFFSIN